MAATTIAALAERTARLEERADTADKHHDDVKDHLRSLSNRVWGILVAVLATLMTVVLSAFKPG